MARLLRCALYTRKSSEEGLDQSFNSLDAQREASAAYVKSQKAEGWRAINACYDDGGYSGGTMERPALKRLLIDIAAGRVDVVVVYKIDRLTRSLADFARIIEVLDSKGASFVSVTQSFNTTTSMGRLTLNVLLSFAQFEREVTGERIRDKIAASKARGMWMGGTLPLGYDAPQDNSRALVVNAAEAEVVRTIFAAYLELGSVHALQRWLADRGIRSKQRVTRSGRVAGGQPFSRGALFHLLRNRTYLGQIVHRDKVHPGAHSAIMDAAVFEAVGQSLDANAHRHQSRRERVARASLCGRIVDELGQPMSPSFSHGARGQVYRYYVSAPLQQGQKRLADDVIRRVPAPALETVLGKILGRIMPGQTGDPLARLVRVEIHGASLQLLLLIRHLPTVRRHLAADEQVVPDADAALLRLIVPIRMRLRGGRTWIEGGVPSSTRRDRVLIKALRAAHAMVARDAQGLPVLEAAPESPYARKLIRLAFLAPDLQRAILAGEQPPGLSLERLLDTPIPLCWSQQRAMIDRI